MIMSSPPYIVKESSMRFFSNNNHLIIFAVFFTHIPFMVLGQLNEPITPLPLEVKFDKAKASLGKKLFNDKRLSADNSISCASCHDLEKGYGTDLLPVSEGVGGKHGERNSPTVYNAVYNFTQFWDGRAEDLSQQIDGPITNPLEMGLGSLQGAVDKIKSDQTYQQAFKQLYATEITIESMKDAIVEFEKSLVTTNAPFDQYLRGDESAITAEQKNGYQLFKTYGCVSCHQGQNVGGNMFQKLGVLKNINLQKGSLSKDLGRYNITKNEWDKRVFKVPSLRLAAVTPPYFHDGSVATLKDAVKVMVDYQLGREVPEEDILAIVEFLKSLVGELPKGVNS